MPVGTGVGNDSVLTLKTQARGPLNFFFIIIIIFFFFNLAIDRDNETEKWETVNSRHVTKIPLTTGSPALDSAAPKEV